MPRKMGVYRTIKTINVEVIVLDVEKEKTFTEVYQVPKYYKDNLLNFLRKNIETEIKRVAHIKSIKSEESHLYFLDLYNFINCAEVVK